MKAIPTIKDVARMAGVSISTVSRVMNKSPKISPGTSNKVMDIIRQLNYEPNNIARSLSRKKTNTIGVILEDIGNPFFAEIAKGVEETLKKNKYSMFLTNTNFEEELELKLTNLLLSNKVDGIIISPINDRSKSLEILKKRGVPFFLVNCRTLAEKFNWVTTDNVRGGYLATKYLIDLGYKRIMHIKGADDQPSKDKFRGFKKAVIEGKLRMSEQVVIDSKAKTSKDGINIMENYIRQKGIEGLPGAIFAVNDDVALGVLQVFSKKGVRVPEEVSLVGYDDIDIASYLFLTTVRQEKYKMGEIAASELISEMESGESYITKQLLMEPKLIVRNSCKLLT
ncbi:MAG: LacI family DNA-binding transcriptional regulator [Actinobacteria bacterium]|nr:LacI family DNA-binding transcriptional regulator [Actinomycetota bacterium]